VPTAELQELFAQEVKGLTAEELLILKESDFFTPTTWTAEQKRLFIKMRARCGEGEAAESQRVAGRRTRFSVPSFPCQYSENIPVCWYNPSGTSLPQTPLYVPDCTRKETSMCGRYSIEITTPQLQERFDIAGDIPELSARYNVAPTQQMPVVVHHSPNSVELMRWGLILFWAKDARVGAKMINARAETVAEKPAYRKALSTHRCLVPASGFYEWQRSDRGAKAPYWIFCTDAPLFAFAGLHAAWKSPEDEWIHSYTIITTEANDMVAPIHNRMPVILDREDETLWLDPDQTEAERLLPLLRPYPAAKMAAHAVSRRVNNPAFDTADLITPEVNSQ